MPIRPPIALNVRNGKTSNGYTLVEVLVALTLTLILLTAVVKVFSGVGDGISKSRKALETYDRLRLAEAVLRSDLGGVTVSMMPPWRPEEAKGYLEIGENGLSYDPYAAILDPTDPRSSLPAYDPKNPNTPSNRDTTIGQRGDILMFTTRSLTRPFIGRFANSGTNQTMQSDVAEVAWFLRGRTLHRRMLLVAPGVTPAISGFTPASAFYQQNDISVHRVTDPTSKNTTFVANSLSDLARRENRFAHPTNPPVPPPTAPAIDPSKFPFDVRSQWGLLGLPTMRESVNASVMNGSWTSGSFPQVSRLICPIYSSNDPKQAVLKQVDLWQNFCFDTTSNTTYWLADWQLINAIAGTSQATPPATTSRDADDIILTNVIGFDVKVWDPEAGAYVDLGYGGSTRFGGNGNTASGLTQVYDTFPLSYESEGTYHFDSGGAMQTDSLGGQSNNGFDDKSSGMVDGPADNITSPPYPVALRGIQIKIRVFEPSSKQVREVTIEHDFVPK